MGEIPASEERLYKQIVNARWKRAELRVRTIAEEHGIPLALAELLFRMGMVSRSYEERDMIDWQVREIERARERAYAHLDRTARKGKR